MLDALVLTAALALPNADNDREWAVQRPSRGTHSSVIREAATPPARLKNWAACVLKRESGGNFDRRSSGQAARNPSSSASGRWQFLQNSWGHGLPYMVRDRLIKFGMPKSEARQVRLYLSSRPITQWPGWYQDIGAFEVMERGGTFHWNGPGC